ncbi:nitroreductase/quinone reductase family protein [Cryobacterium luteum]|uniref:Nitroreductase family deazaflavin-dependent oxidoreductase n=1 Tax=Cryobacterium luteum TaxID=1424661 RepID=A0A1H8EW14_9MICO|nr:nitroreductase/quinone reductase family protein [Cryobacterium luteum]TFB85428.1 nitroreductase family deazaflavin-dependent oxidoreductase [Cryobacterium luteum]SEN23655.1 deazaflavin-dependent oxidoreductase, nitroreductase family [Cryobacterium luteum]
MTLRDRLTDLGMLAMNGVHRMLLVTTRGRLGWTIGTMAAVELHTIGRSSGQRRSTMLTAPIHEGGRYVLVASKGGDDRHPFWYANLVAQPEVELTIRGVTRPFRARTASSAEKAELWPRVIAAYPGYRKYQTKTDRDIPVVICDPRP